MSHPGRNDTEGHTGSSDITETESLVELSTSFSGYGEGEDEELEETVMVQDPRKQATEPAKSEPRQSENYESVAQRSSVGYLRKKPHVPLTGTQGSSSNLSLSDSEDTSLLYQIVTDLGPEELRWFYQENKTWKPFIGYDSLRVELTWRRLWNVRAKLGPESGPVSVEPVPVRSSLYVVDLTERGCYPLYWEESEKTSILRGQWFVDGTWQPLPEDVSDLIEQEHLRTFGGQRLPQTFGDKLSPATDSKYAIHTLKLLHSHVDWHSVDEVYLYSDATTSKIARKVTQKLGFSTSGTRLHRGYVEEASLEDKPPRTTHIVFVVHGIGQMMDQGSIIRNTSMLRDMARKVEEKHFYNNTTDHVEFLPVEWRTKLELDGDTVNSITPQRLSRIRNLLNSSAMDIMYYTSPLYRDELVKGLESELNRLYTLFCTQNPDFSEKGGKVSIVSHSLGCVITYDIMTGWNPVRMCEQFLLMDEGGSEENWASDEERNLIQELYATKQHIQQLQERLVGLKSTWKTHSLKFKVEYFFCLGSPLAVFLALRGIRPGNAGSQEHILPHKICNRIFNIFYPTDPVAYRLEPLILKNYTFISPVQIHLYHTANPIPYRIIKPCYAKPYKEAHTVSTVPDSEAMPSPPLLPTIPKQRLTEPAANIGLVGATGLGRGIEPVFSKLTPTLQTSDTSNIRSEQEDPPAFMFGFTEGARSLPSPINDLLEPPLELEHRIDFELREGLVENSYVSAITSHTAYWSSMDVVLFLLTFLYAEDCADEEVEKSKDTANSYKHSPPF
ncbi:hypothetical protein NDU88_003941 [Pleurodeles waltl]|uniref:DDHD domain-containing protein n=1 Tax=Pleurodeles waltl TaxID=8319 RepID=A0AAV7UDN3_PLEWA|nr:hypothetical protein NDU88_003941 [Pleurodeles waltl]